MNRQLHTNYTDCGVGIFTVGEGSVETTKTDNHCHDLEQLFSFLECSLEQRLPTYCMQENFSISQKKKKFNKNLRKYKLTHA